jgi:acetyl esterase/lipase
VNGGAQLIEELKKMFVPSAGSTDCRANVGWRSLVLNAWADPVSHTYKTVGACAIRADVYQPAGSAGSNAAIVFIHGGALIYGSRKAINRDQLRRYLAAGYTVIAIDYRLAPETKLPEIIKDLEDAFAWINRSGPEELSVDPKRLAVVGHSAGGYLALMSGFRVSPRPRALVSFYGYGDIVGDWYSRPDPFYCQQPAVSEDAAGRHVMGHVVSEPYEGRGKDLFYLYCRQNGLWPLEVSGHDPEEEPSFFLPYCPVQNITTDYPPTLLLHGDRDTDVPSQQSVLMDQELSRHGVTHELAAMPGRGHVFDGDMDDPLVESAFSTVLSFLDSHTKFI